MRSRLRLIVAGLAVLAGAAALGGATWSAFTSQTENSAQQRRDGGHVLRPRGGQRQLHRRRRRQPPAEPALRRQRGDREGRHQPDRRAPNVDDDRRRRQADDRRHRAHRQPDPVAAGRRLHDRHRRPRQLERRDLPLDGVQGGRREPEGGHLHRQRRGLAERHRGRVLARIHDRRLRRRQRRAEQDDRHAAQLRVRHQHGHHQRADRGGHGRVHRRQQRAGELQRPDLPLRLIRRALGLDGHRVLHRHRRQRRCGEQRRLPAGIRDRALGRHRHRPPGAAHGRTRSPAPPLSSSAPPPTPTPASPP